VLEFGTAPVAVRLGAPAGEPVPEQTPFVKKV
jgi:hypothetical protein